MIQVAIPLPPAKLSPNSVKSNHWRVTQKARKLYQAECGRVLDLEKIGRLPIPLEIQYEFFTAQTKVVTQGKKTRLPDKQYRPWDGDNANGSMKSFQDLLTERGHIPGDTARQVRLLPAIIYNAEESKGQQGVIVTFREAM